MGGEGHIAAMIASLKANSRRKKRAHFDRENLDTAKRGKPIESLELTPETREALLEQIRKDKALENKHRTYKLILSLFISIVVISASILVIKLTFMD